MANAAEINMLVDIIVHPSMRSEVSASGLDIIKKNTRKNGIAAIIVPSRIETSTASKVGLLVYSNSYLTSS